MTVMPQPSAADERGGALRSRARTWLRDGVISEEQRQAIDAHSKSEWRRVGLILYIVFFVLTVNVLGAVFGFSALLHLPKGVITAVVAIGAAEALIRRQKFFGTGIESALWIGGLFAFIFGLPSQGKVEALLVFAAAAAIAGWRVLNPLFGGLAVVLVAAYVAVKADLWWPPLIFCAVVALAALVAAGRRIERDSTEMLLGVLMILMPLTGYVAAKVYSGHQITNVPLAVAMAVLGAILLGAGVVRRGRFELLSGFASVVVSAIELQLSLAYSTEAKLIAGGIVLVVIASIVARVLRGTSVGFVAPPTSLSRYDEAMQIAATLAAAPSHHPRPATPGRESGGGGFGGAGASGDF
jgi:hypothetical protein